MTKKSKITYSVLQVKFASKRRRHSGDLGKAGRVSRLDAFCYDNTKTQVGSWMGKRHGRYTK